MVDGKISIRPATPGDCQLVHELVYELAVYEKEPDKVLATPDDFHRALFGDRPCANVVFATLDGHDVGMALFFYSFSTWTGKPGLFLEDLYVRKEFRARGVGTALLKHLARRAVREGCTRVEWNALDWNTPAIDFYTEKVKAVPLDEWRGFRLSGDALNNFAESS